jgi:ATP-dependent Clp protease ATP-binding subunit ClpA
MAHPERAVMTQSQSTPSVPNLAWDNAAPADPAFVAKLQQAANLANENCDRATALAHTLSAQLREAQSRINQLELEADGLVDRLMAEVETAVGKLQSDANARVERMKREADARIARVEAEAESRVRHLQGELRHSSSPTRRKLKHGSRTTVSPALRPKGTSASVARGLKLKIGSFASRPTWRRPNFAPTAPNSGWC